MVMNIQLVARQLKKVSKYATHYIYGKEKHSYLCHVFEDGKNILESSIWRSSVWHHTTRFEKTKTCVM